MKDFNPDWITKTGLDPLAVEQAEELGKILAPKDFRDSDAMTTSQLRRFFGALKKVQMSAKVKEDNFRLIDVKLLKPKLAYAVGRAGERNRINDFYKQVGLAIDKVNTRQDFLNMVDWVEAIVAYHKANGGKDNAKN